MFEFLLRYTRPTTTSFMTAFGIKTSASISFGENEDFDRSNLPKDFEIFPTTNIISNNLLDQYESVQTYEAEFEHENNAILDVMQIDDEDLELFSDQNTYDREIWSKYTGLNRYQPSYTTPLEDAGHALVDELIHYATTVKQSGHKFPPISKISKGLPFLLAGRNHMFICNYFSQWNHHSPVVHRATFSLASTPQPLLLAILLTGALLSSNSEDVRNAKNVLDLAELYVFNHTRFRSLLEDAQGDCEIARVQGLHAVQAAFQITQIRLHDESFQKRQHARCKRFDQVINAARALGLQTTRCAYQPHSFSYESFDWHDFSITEASIRLMNGIYQLEASFSVFYDIPPRLLIEEMRLDLPCTVEAYTASNAEDCLQIILQQSNETRMKLSEVLTIICYCDDDAVDCLSQDLEILHLWAVILGKHADPKFHLL